MVLHGNYYTITTTHRTRHNYLSTIYLAKQMFEQYNTCIYKEKVRHQNNITNDQIDVRMSESRS